MEDYTIILRNHNVRLRETVNALEIYRFVAGLSQFDLEHIKCEATNLGNSMAIDKLIESICRKGTKSLISFVHGLQKCGNEDIANIIIKDISTQCPNIYALMGTSSKPVATVSPRTISPSPSTDTQQRNAFTSGSASNNRHQYTNYLTNIPMEDSTEDILDTDLDSLENEDFIYLVELLNIDKKWEKLATKLKLKRKDIKELGCQDNPSEKLLDDFSHLHVRELLNYLGMANLGDVSDHIRIRLNIDNSNLQIGTGVYGDMLELQQNIDNPKEEDKISENKLTLPNYSVDSMTENCVIPVGNELIETNEGRNIPVHIKENGGDENKAMSSVNRREMSDRIVRSKNSQKVCNLDITQSFEEDIQMEQELFETTEKMIVTSLEDNVENSEKTPEQECDVLRQGYAKKDQFRDLQNSLPDRSDNSQSSLTD